MPAIWTMYVLIAFIFLAPPLVAVLWLRGVQVSVYYLQLRTLAKSLFLKLARTESRLSHQLEERCILLSQKNAELLELSKKHRELNELVLHAKDKSLKQQRRLLRKPNDEALKSKASVQRALFEQLSESTLSRLLLLRLFE